MDQPTEQAWMPGIASFTFWALMRVDDSTYALHPYLRLYPEMSVLHLPAGQGTLQA